MSKQNSFQHTGYYVCECGKEFTKSQSFNTHRSRCRIYHEIKGTVEEYDNFILDNAKKVANTAKARAEIRKQEQEELNKKLLEFWISEQHKCERCGKVMTEYFGTGRFCSQSCANSKVYTDEQRKNISKGLIKSYNPELSDIEIENISKVKREKYLNRKPRLQYNGKELPKIELKTHKQGWNSRNTIPYSEAFWKKVLDNNHIEYKQNVNIWKPGFNNYFLDFLIGNIDLEIDGGLHDTPECKEKDRVRTEWLESQGYVVYRIKWVNPISDKNKIIVNKQIDDLFEFLGIERIN